MRYWLPLTSLKPASLQVRDTDTLADSGEAGQRGYGHRQAKTTFGDASQAAENFFSTSMLVLPHVTLLQTLCQSIHYNKAFWFLIPVLLRARQLWEPQRCSSTNRNHCKQFQEIPDFPVLLWPWRNTDQCHFEQNLPPQRSPLHFPLAYAHVHWWMSDYHPSKDQPVCFCSFCLAVENKYLAQTVARY